MLLSRSKYKSKDNEKQWQHKTLMKMGRERERDEENAWRMLNKLTPPFNFYCEQIFGVANESKAKCRKRKQSSLKKKKKRTLNSKRPNRRSVFLCVQWELFRGKWTEKWRESEREREKKSSIINRINKNAQNTIDRAAKGIRVIVNRGLKRRRWCSPHGIAPPHRCNWLCVAQSQLNVSLSPLFLIQFWRESLE